ncbi:MAG: PAS domain S-box protein, partial [Oscillochloris sp.]|nr:PAS domain S-box protein [Oscillochloris sp.]
MTNSSIRVLFIEDNPADTSRVCAALNSDLFSEFVITCAPRAAGLAHLTHAQIDIVLLDCDLSDIQGRYALAQVCRQAPDLPIVVCFAYTDKAQVVEALRAGAHDYLTKDVAGLAMAGRIIRYVLERHQLRRSLAESESRFSSDMRERKRIEEEMRYAHDLFSHLFHFSPIPTIFTSLPDRIFIDINDAAERLVGYTRQDILGYSVDEFDIFADSQEYKKILQMLTEQVRVSGFEFKMRMQNGIEKACSLYIETLDLHGNMYSLAQIVDISEQKNIEQALRHSEKQYRYLFEHNPHPMFAYDLKTLAFLAINDAAIAKYGYSRDAFLHMTIADIRPPEDRARLQANIALPRPALQHSGEWRHRLKDGTIIDVEISSHTLRLSGREAALVVAQDITARKQAEAALRASESRFVTIFENSPIAIGISPLSNKLTNINSAFLRMFGYTREEVIGRTTLDLGIWVHPPDRLRVLNLLLTQKRISAFETISRSKSGDERHVLLWGELIEIDNEPNLLIQIMDITELKAMQNDLLDLNHSLEERVRQRTTEVQDLYDHAPIGYHSLDSDGTLMRINQTELNWLGYTREQMLGHPITDFMTPASLALFHAIFPSFRQNGRVRDIELELIRSDGTTFPILVNATAIYDEFGRYVMSRSVLFDNSERRKAEMALRESETQNRLLFEEAPDAVVLFDRDGRVVRMNRAFEGITGYGSEQLIGQRLNDMGMVSDEEVAWLGAAIVEPIQSQSRSAAIAFKLTRASGELCDVGVRVFEIQFRGTHHYLTTMRDITVETRAEEALRLANAELARAARAKDEFLANMSHELRTPLTAILALGESLLEQIHGPLNERQQRSLRTIESSGRHLLALISD